jgi:hypothetical protein
VQRFRDALNLNVRFHMLALDGVYAEDKRGYIRFHAAPPPSDAEVARVARRLHRRVGRLLERRGLGPQADPDEADTLLHNQPLLAEVYGASVSGRVALGPRAGRRLAKAGDQIDAEDFPPLTGPRCATISGFSVHANASLPAHDRMRLARLSLLPDGRLLYRLKRRWLDGTSHIILEPLDLVAKLAALVPPPRFNLARYHGVLRPSAGCGPLVIPSRPEIEHTHSHPGCEAGGPLIDSEQGGARRKSSCRRRNYPWALLMRRVFDLDVLQCDSCGGRMRILAAIERPDAIRKILGCMGLPSRPPPVAPAPPDPDIDRLYFS